MNPDRLLELARRISAFPPHERAAKCHALLGCAIEFEAEADAEGEAGSAALDAAALHLRVIVGLVKDMVG